MGGVFIWEIFQCQLSKVILQSKANASGQLLLTAGSGNLNSATVSINVKETDQIPAVAIAN
jgi:hypothetical protein